VSAEDHVYGKDFKEMTREDMAVLASRSLALLMAVWTLVDLTYLPEQIFSLVYHLGHQSVVGTRDHWSSLYSLVITFHVIRLLLTALAGIWFWKGGPVPETLFAGAIETRKTETGA
jgi:hypothetical protein